MSAVLPSRLDVAAPRRDVANVSTEDRVTGAIERLALSRERLRSTMMPPPAKASARPSGAGSAGSFAAGLTDRLKDLPGAALLLDAVRTWWAQHPLRTASMVAAEASRKFAAPLAERNPLALILGAVVVGALFALTKPWRWLLRPALFAGLVPALGARLMRQLPLESWLRMFASVSARTARETVRDEPASSATAAATDTNTARPGPASVPPAPTVTTTPAAAARYNESVPVPMP
jgi:hypothetical protein